MNRYPDITGCIGNTPLVRLGRFYPPRQGVEVFAKLEYLNPGGSVKDRREEAAMITERALRTRLDLPYEEAVERAVEALKGEGFGVLTQIDVQTTLKKKLGANFRRYVILGACNPPLAHRALQADVEVGLLLPCNVVVYEEGEGSVVAAVDPMSMLDKVADPELAAVSREARSRLERVIGSLGQSPI